MFCDGGSPIFRWFPYFHFVVWKRDAWTELDIPSAETLEALARQPMWRISKQGFESGVR